MTFVRESYLYPGVDEAATVKYLRDREGDSQVHRHQYGERCEGHDCYVVKGRQK